MADVKISELTAQASANVDVSADVLALVDTSATQTKKISVENLLSPITIDKSAGTITSLGTVTGNVDFNGDLDVAGSVASASLTTTGNIGVGSTTTTSPSSASRTLRIQHDTGSAGLVLCGDNNNESAWDILANVDGALEIRKNNYPQLNIVGGTGVRIESGGSGATAGSPGAQLHVAHSSSTAYNGGAEILESAIIQNTNGSDGSGVNNVASLGLQVASGATSQAFINYVRTGDNTGDFTFSQRTGSSSYAEHMRIESTGKLKSTGGMYFTGTALDGNDTGISSSGDGGDLRIYTNGTQSTTFKSDGKVGIGTTSINTNAKLHIRGGDSGQTSSSNNTQLTVEGSGSGGIQILTGTTNVGGLWIGDSNGSENGGKLYYSNNDDSWSFYNAGSTNTILIESSGRMTTSGDFLPGADVILSNGRGISFANMSNNANMTSELFDDYEEGTIDTSVTGITASTNDVTGTYTKIGRLVHVEVRVTISGKSGGTGNPYIQLPFNAGGAGIGASIVGAQLSKNTIITGGSPAFLGLYGSTNQLYANDVSGNYIGEGDWGNGVMGFNLVYNT